jgi:hypothetical protein
MKANQIQVYGASDDLIEIRDDANGEDEHGAYKTKFVRFSDGTVIKAEYAPEGYGANWKLERVKEGTAGYAHTAVNVADENAEPNSDVVTLTDIGLCVTGVADTIDPTQDELVEALEDFCPDDYTLDQLTRILAITKEA